MTGNLVFGKDELIEKFKRLEDAAQGAMLANIATAGAMVIVNAAKDNIKEKKLIETRTLSRSIHAEIVEQSNERAVAAVGTNLEYAAIHEFGGTLQPKNAKHLAIPVGSRTGSPLRHSDLAVRKTANGNLVMVDATGTVQYVLKQSVTIPARPYLRPAADEHHQGIQSQMTKAFVAQINKAVA